MPDFREGLTRNPVVYADLESCRERGLDIATLEFKPMPAPSKHYRRQGAGPAEESPETGRKGLSIAEAKEGLAVYLDVPIEAIHITISA